MKPERTEVSPFTPSEMSATMPAARSSINLTRDEFVLSTRDQDAVIRNFEVIGEASRNIDRDFPDFVAAHPELPIRSAYDMRNALSHGYFGVDLEVVWQTIHSDLPVLKRNILAILSPTG